MGKKVSLLFPGQGSQYIGMGKELLQNFEEGKATFAEANEILGFNLEELCLNGDINELTKTENAQPAILTMSVAAFRVYLKEIGIIPALCAGHSLGEITALTCAGVIKFSDALRLVKKRGQFMQEAVPLGVGGMTSISGLKMEEINKVCEDVSKDGNIVVISNYNSKQQIVISGHKAAVDAAAARLAEMGANAIPLKVSAPFHSPLMTSAADRFKEELLKCKFSELKYPVLSNVTAKPYKGVDSIVENLSLQLIEPVRWQECMSYMLDKGIHYGVELGPKAILKGFMKNSAKSIAVFSYDSNEDINALKKELEYEINEKITVITKCMAIAVSTRNFNWNEVEYQKGVVKPYKRIEKIQEEIEASEGEPTLQQMEEALDMLKSILETKQVPVNEQIERFNQVFDETGTRGLFPNFKMPR